MRKNSDDPNTASAPVDDRNVRGQSVACPHEHMDDDGGPPRREASEPEPEWAGF